MGFASISFTTSNSLKVIIPQTKGPHFVFLFVFLLLSFFFWHTSGLGTSVTVGSIGCIVKLPYLPFTLGKKQLPFFSFSFVFYSMDRLWLLTIDLTPSICLN